MHMTSFWSAWVWFWTLAHLFVLAWLLYSNYKASVSDQDHHRRHETHDGIGESFLSIPRWWALSMAGTIFAAFVYLFLFPGLGNYPGVLNWSSKQMLEREQEKLSTKTHSILAQYSTVAVSQLMQDKQAMLMAAREFRNSCEACHGDKGKGQQYFPDLTDNDWLYGGTEEAIKTTLTYGRRGAMPGWETSLSRQQLDDVNAYVRHFSQEGVHANANGEKVFKQFCSACHGQDAKGNMAMGAPNLTDNIWLYGGSRAELNITLRVGRNGHMPAQQARLGDDKIHLLTAYIMHLSAGQQ